VKFHEVPPELVDDLWPIVAPWIDEALDHQLWLSVDDVRVLCLTGRAQLVVLEDAGKIHAAGVVEVQEYPSVRVGNVVAMGGTRGQSLRYLDACIDWFGAFCARRGCGSMMVMGRAGWARLFQRRGWRTRRGTVAWAAVLEPGDANVVSRVPPTSPVREPTGAGAGRATP
jgi:hypothetical protein